MFRRMLCVVSICLLAMLAWVSSGFAWHVYSFRCGTCHGDGFVGFAHDSHSALDCTACHAEMMVVPLESPAPSKCAECHAPGGDPIECPLVIQHEASPAYDPEGPSCLDCHAAQCDEPAPECETDDDCDDNFECVSGVCESLDIDLDGVINAEDNCPDFANTDQADQDDDGVGDVCDSEPFFFWPTLTEDVDVLRSHVPMENDMFFDSTRQAIIWTTRDPEATNDGLGWSSRLGVAHSYVSYREVGEDTWSPEEETVYLNGIGFFGRWSWFYPVREITVSGNYEIKLISEDSDGNRSEEAWTIQVAVQ